MSANDGHIVITRDFQKGENYLSMLGYQSSREYLALPDILKTLFQLAEQEFNVRNAPADKFHEWLLSLADWDFDNIDTATWPVHQRWRVINELLKDGELILLEVPNGFKLEVVELPEVEQKSELEVEKVEVLSEQNTTL